MKKIYLILIFIMLLLLSACEDYVTDIDPYNDRIVDKALNDVNTLETQIEGLHLNIIDVAGALLCADGLSDQLWFEIGKIKGSTYSSYDEVDDAQILDDNSSTGQPYDDIHEVRLYAEMLIKRVKEKIKFTNSAKHKTLKNKALYFGNLYAGLTRYYLATYYGNSKTIGGATIDLSKLIPSKDIYAQAVTFLKTAIATETTDYNKRVANTLIARIYLVTGDYANAAAYAKKGMVKGDKALKMLYNIEEDNIYRKQAGQKRDQWAVSPRYVSYIAKDAEEEKRISLTQKTYKGNLYYIQTKYVKDSEGKVTPIEILNWQENNLMLAELAVRGVYNGNAADLLNEVRGYYKMTSKVTNPTLAVVMTERDKELFCTGMRLVDQRRTNTFHIADGWQYFPIPRNEKTRNPNID